MKRQVVCVRRPNEESEQVNDKKRMKVLHNDSNEEVLNENTHAVNINLENDNKNIGNKVVFENAQSDLPENSSPKSSYENNTHENGSIKAALEPTLLNNMNSNSSDENVRIFASNEACNGSSSESNGNTIQPPVLEPETNFQHVQSLNNENSNREFLPSNNNFINGNELEHESSAQKDTCSPVQLENQDVAHQENPVLTSSTSQEENCNQHADPESKLDGQESSIVDIDSLLLSHINVTQLEGHADVIFCVAADESIVLSSSGDTTIKVWNVDIKKEICSFAGHKDAVTSVLLLNQRQSENLGSKFPFCNALRIAASASLDCHIKLWSVFEGQEILSLYTFNGITCMDYLESHMYIVIGTEGGKLELWDFSSSKVVHSVHAHEDSISSVKVEDYYIYSASVDGTVKVWLFEEDELQPLYTRRRKEVSVNKDCFVPTHWKAIAAHDNMLYLGDNSSNIKVLDWRKGRLRLFRNHTVATSICEAVVVSKNILLSSFYDSSSDTGGINVWRLPSMCYVCTMTGDVQDICSLAVTCEEKRLRIVSGGHQLLVWDFNFSLPPEKNSQEAFCVKEIDTLGGEIDEKLTESEKIAFSKKLNSSESAENNADKKNWCNVM